tara:strand:+ start:1121 stop:1327 length:207 start_codon:yes stop_codon:yes gene_type:complete
MNEDNLNMEIRKFLKKVGISSQRILENEIYEADKKGAISIGSNIDVEMTLTIKSLNFQKTISGKIKVE